MKKLINASGTASVTILQGTCILCNEPGKTCMMPTVTGTLQVAYSVTMNGNYVNGGQIAVCIDCCRSGAELLKDYEPLPDQV